MPKKGVPISDRHREAISESMRKRWIVKDPTLVAARQRATRARVVPVGTKRLTSDGYISIRTDRGWELEHRFVVRMALGRELTSKEHVHHKNGNTIDNSPNNLEVKQCGKHNSDHMRVRIKSGWVPRFNRSPEITAKYSAARKLWWKGLSKNNLVVYKEKLRSAALRRHEARRHEAHAQRN